jgi:hypothetical protein
LNGRFAGTVPESGILDLPQVSVGNAELHLHHNGFPDVRQTISFAAGDNQRTIVLEELKAKIAVDVDPPNAQLVYFRPGRSGRQIMSAGTIEVPAGTYVLEASAPGHSTATSTVTLTPGESTSVSLRLSAMSPAVRSIDMWQGWDLDSGWLKRDKPGPIFRNLPDNTSHLTFFARWEREKSLVHWSTGPLILVFRTADGVHSVSFRITDKGVSWTVVGQSLRQDGKIPLNLGKNPQTIEADIRSSVISMSINGAAVATVGLNLVGESKPLQFGFLIDQDQIVRLRDIRIRAQPPGSN